MTLYVFDMECSTHFLSQFFSEHDPGTLLFIYDGDFYFAIFKLQHMLSCLV